MGTYTDFSQLKKIKPADAPAPAPVPAPEPVDAALAGAETSTDYFSNLLGPCSRQEARPASPSQPRRTTIVTPATVARVREEQAEDARAAERAAFAAREAELLEDLEAQKAACESLATDLATLRQEHTARVAELDTLQNEKRRLEEAVSALESDRRALAEALAAERARPHVDEAFQREAAEKNLEIERLKALLVEAQRTSLSSSVLLEKPAAFSEKFTGELREHVIEALSAANEAAEAGGRDRRARILEAVLGANPASGELDRRRDAVKQIVKDAGSKLDDAALAALEDLGFRYISGKNHHKLEWAGIRFPLAKTPSDYRACLNSAAEIANRVF